METMHKRVASVTPVPLGDETTTAQVTTDTVILVANSGDFYEGGGHVRINGEVYTYSAVEEGEDDDTPDPSITLDTGLVGNVAAGTAVEVWDPALSVVVTDWMVAVTDDLDGSPGIAYLDYGLIPLLAEGLPPGVGDSVTVAVDGSDDWRVTNIHGRTAYLNSELITDPSAPDDSPAVVAVGMPATILLRTTSPISATTFLTYQIFFGGDWVDLNPEPIRSEIYVVKGLPDDSDLVEGTVYSFRTVATNAAGTAGPSASTDGQTDISAVALVAAQLITEQVIAGFALLGTVHIGGDAFTLTPPGVDPDNLPGGLRILLSDGGLIHLPADGSPAVFSGDVVASYLEVVEGARLSGEIGVFGAVELAASDVPDPTVAPTVQTYYGDTQLPVSGTVGLASGVGGADWATISAGQVVTITGGVVTNSTTAPLNAVGITSAGGLYYVLHWRAEAGDFAVSEYDDTLVIQSTSVPSGTASTKATRARIGKDVFENVVTAIESHDGTDWAGDVTMTRYDPSDWSVITTIDVPSVGPIGGVYFGDGGGEFPDVRWVLHPRDADVEVFNTSGVRQSSEEWPRPYGKTVRGMAEIIVNLQVVDNAGVLRLLSGATDAPADTYWWSYAWVDADTHTTLASPETEHERPLRAGIYVACSPAPQQASAGTHVANLIEIFAASSSGGTKNSQGSLGVGVKSVTTAEVALATGGAPGSNNWLGITPTGSFAAETGGFSVDGESDGDVGTGTFRDSVRTAIQAASETVAGKLEIATQAEVTTGTDDARAVSPLKLATAVPAASTTAVGKVELATSAETITGTDTVRAVTPAADAAALAAYVPAASETAAGKAEVATQAEVTTGTDDSRIVTPLKLATAVPAASETAAGKVELATQAEVTTGTDDARAVTPLKLATAVPAASAAAAGKVELATNAETITGTDTVRAVTPASFRAGLDELVLMVGTTANFNAIGNTRNTANKFAGKPAWNTTSNRPIWAVGATAASVWVFADGTTAHTPV